MKKFKKILLSLMLTFIIILFSGCASIQYQRTLYENGRILDAVSVKLDTQAITNAGYNIEKVSQDVKIKMQEYLNQVVNSFYNRDDGLLDIEKIAVYNNLNTLVTTKNDYIIASIEFNNYNTFKYFYGLHLIEDNEDDTNIVESFLYNKNVSTGKTIFAGQDANFINNEFMAYFNNDFSIENCDLTYVFGTPESKLHSDADYTYKEDGVIYHQWMLTDKNDDISTFTFQMKPVNWYILALIVTFALIIILFIVSIFVKNKKNTLKIATNEIKSQINNDNKNEND